MLLRTDLFCSVEKVYGSVDPKKIPDPIGSGTFVVVVATNNPCLSLSGSISWLKPEGWGGGVQRWVQREIRQRRAARGLALSAWAMSIHCMFAGEGGFRYVTVAVSWHDV
jgi:hypothetical protein